MKHRLRALLGSVVACSTLAAHSATVTYTFTEYDVDAQGQPFIVYQLRHSLDHFLASGEHVDFALSDIVIDPNGAGNTVALQQAASPDAPTFGGTGTFVTFGGAAFCKIVACDDDAAGRHFAFSYDMDVGTDLSNNPTGTWTDSSQTGWLERLDITVSNDPPGRTPEPGSLALLALALATAGMARRRQRH